MLLSSQELGYWQWRRKNVRRQLCHAPPEAKNSLADLLLFHATNAIGKFGKSEAVGLAIPSHAEIDTAESQNDCGR